MSMPQSEWFFHLPGEALEQMSGESHRYQVLHIHTAAILSQ